MLTYLCQLVEALLVRLVNARPWRGRKGAPEALPSPEAEEALPSGHVLIGTAAPVRSAAADASLSGTPDLAPRPMVLTPEDRRRHLYALGSSGCGKTSLMLHCIEADIRDRRAFCAIDIRGDIVDRILELLAAAETPESVGKRLLLIDLRQDGYVLPFNPLAGSGDPHGRAFLALDAIRAHWQGSWGPVIETGLRHAFVALAQTGFSLHEAQAVFTSDAFRQALAGRTDAHTRRFLLEFGGLSPEQRRQASAPVLNKLDGWLAWPLLRLMLSQRATLPFRELLRDQPGLVILVALAGDRYHGVSRLIGALLLTSLQAELLRAEAAGSQAALTLYLDEFQNLLASTEQLLTFLAEGRRYGVSLFLANQVLAQLPSDLRDVLRGNVHSQFFYQCGPDAAELAPEVMAEGGPIPRDEARLLLSRQGIGAAVLARRGHTSQKLDLLPAPMPPGDPAAAAALREAALRAYGRPRAEVEAELAARERQIAEGAYPDDAAAPPGASRSARAGANSTEARRVRKRAHRPLEGPPPDAP